MNHLMRMLFLVTGIVLSALIKGQQLKCDINPAKACRPKTVLIIVPAQTAGISIADNHDLHSFMRVMDVCGIGYTTIKSDELTESKLGNHTVILVPHAAAIALSQPMISELKKSVDAGNNILFNGNSLLDEAFGIKLGRLPQAASKGRDLLFNKTRLYWNDSLMTTGISEMPDACQIIAIDDSSQVPVIVSGSLGKGRYISFANLFDPYTDKGYSTYPYLIELLNHFFGNITLVRRVGSEMYFDPGMHPFPLHYDDLARMWHEYKIKKIHAAGWYYDDEDIDYDKLIRACHSYGIQVYCWLELPMVSIKFWNDHPTWREKTATLRDAHVDWRYLMNLADTACRKQVFSLVGKVLDSLDWDGVNMAELYYETVDDNRLHPDLFTPMNDWVRADFQRKAGFDPHLLFDTTSIHYWGKSDADWYSYLSYRQQMISGLKAAFISFLTDISSHKSNFETMLTVIDVTLVPQMTYYNGEVLQNTLDLFKKFPITLQIEDPANCWGLTPERYEVLGKYFRNYVKEKNRLVFDCNVVMSHEKGFGGFPSEIPAGEEIRQITYNMSLFGARPIFYAEDGIYPGDFDNISMVLARGTRIKALNDSTWNIHAPSTVMIHTGAKSNMYKLDNKPWQASAGDQVIIPPGDHLLCFSSRKCDDQTFCLMYINGDLNSARFSKNEMELTYREYLTSCYLMLNQKPLAVFLDGKEANIPVWENSSLSYTIRLPGGKHRIFLMGAYSNNRQ